MPLRHGRELPIEKTSGGHFANRTWYVDERMEVTTAKFQQ
jgi:hypothetical protein